MSDSFDDMRTRAEIGKTLREISAFICDSDWRGKENDCVNLFAHRFLAKRVRPIDRIGIEVAVPQLGGKGRKQAVRKDLVIWKRGGQTTWDASWRAHSIPEAILEWKVRRSPHAKATISNRDRAWLKSFKTKHRAFIGVCVTVAFGRINKVQWEYI